MSALFDLISFASVIILIVGLIKPSLFQRFTKVIVTRKIVTLFSLALLLVSSSISTAIEQPDTKEGNTVNTVSSSTEQQVVNEVTPITTSTAVSTTSKTNPITTPVKTTQPEKPTTAPEDQYYSITSVVDGDTVKVNINGTITTLRLIGMDTPETVDPRKPVQCFGKEASDKAKELLLGKKVRLEKDTSQGELDKYGRTLAYIYREDGLFYNKHMIEQGYAHEYTYNTPYKYQAEFKAAEKAAREAQRGLWSPTTCNGDTTASATVTTAPTPAPESSNPPVQSSGNYYTSSHSSAKYYYPADCSGWKSLSPSYLKSFDSVAALLAKYPSRTLSPSCQ